MATANTGTREPSDRLCAAMHQAAASRLITRWRTLAARIEAYAPPAARAYEQAADDLEEEMRKEPERLDALHALRDELIAALTPPHGQSPPGCEATSYG
jgi:hypothetical protein